MKAFFSKEQLYRDWSSDAWLWSEWAGCQFSSLGMQMQLKGQQLDYGRARGFHVCS